MAIAHTSRDSSPDGHVRVLQESGISATGAPDAQALTLGRYRSFGNWIYMEVGKRCLDCVAASVALVLLAPLLLVVALLVRLDSSGPVLFRQERIGKDHRPFTVLKFRTMQHTPGRALVMMRDADGTFRHKVRDDPRVTHIGKWLRRTSIDELPQLINVLLGHMSLVGPRPELPEIVEHYAPWQHHRHLVRPGLTGWWQVSGRSDRPMHEHTELDIYYVNNISPSLDLKIILRTFRVVMGGFGAF